MSDTWFNVPAFEDVVLKRKIGAPVYLYNFDYFNPKLFPDDYKFNGSFTLPTKTARANPS